MSSLLYHSGIPEFVFAGAGKQKTMNDWTVRVAVLFLVFLLFGYGSVYGAEIDSVTPRNVPLGDSLDTINLIFRERISQGVERANKRAGVGASHCDENLLYTELRKAIFNSFTASWGLKGYQLDKDLRELLADKSYRLRLNDSIYRDINYLEGISLNLKELSDLVNLDGYLVGVDKVGHMFAEGWHYFAMVQEDGRSLHEALNWGQEQEEGKFGYVTTGIFSYADLVANFHGYRFWNRVQVSKRDPLKSLLSNWFTSPYTACKIQLVDSIRQRKLVRAWEVEALFDLGDYLDGSWDEGNNCCSYADPQIEAKVKGRISEIAPNYRCPQSPEACVQAREKYGRWARYLLHPSCLTAEGTD